jgi:diguanylate cyclase (GGDEF)-like protein
MQDLSRDGGQDLSRADSQPQSRGLWKYSPHRALIALGTILITVAVAGGLVGVASSSRAERSDALLTDRYLVLLPAARQVRTSVENFQVVAEQAFAASHVDPGLLATAVQDSTATDQAYPILHRLLLLPGNTGLAPGLPALESTYVASRTGLATILTAGTATTQSARAAVTERAAFTSFDNGLSSLQTAITNALISAANQARHAALDARDGLILALVVGLAFGIAVTTTLARKAWRVERAEAGRDAVQARLAARVEFEGRLQRALEMAPAEPAVFDLVTEALGESTPGLRSELLLADSSRAHFRQVCVTSPDPTATGCGVVSPNDCPAASRGQTLVFPWSTAIDACPNLRGRGCSAVCVPVSITGNSVGVVHVTGIDGVAPAGAVSRDVEVVARRASERLAMLRAYQLSQTEANSDSLTGLMTRRSLARWVGELEETGVPYAVAYADLDHFKLLNDVFGHDAGDRGLRTFSQILRDSLRPSDVPCRYGGEEFVIVLPACQIDGALVVLERVRERLADRLTGGHVPTFTVSFGLAASRQATDFEQVVALADEALMRAKAAGRDQIVVAGDAAEPSTGLPDYHPALGVAELLGDIEAGDSPMGSPYEERTWRR